MKTASFMRMKSWKTSALVCIFLLLLFFLAGPSSGALNGTETLITTDTVSSPQINPVISGSFIAWEDYRPMNPNIYVYDLATGEEFPAAPDENLMQTVPSVYRSRIVWQQADTNMYTYSIQVFDLVSHTLSSIPANPGFDPVYTLEDNCFPKIYEDEIVWQDFNGGDWDISLYNITTSVSTAIVTGAGDQKRPAIFGNYIAYENWSDSAHPEIWLYDITSASSLPVVSGSYAVHPALSQDYVVWQDQTGSMRQVFSYAIATGTVNPVSLAQDIPELMYPAIAGNHVVVEDYRRRTANAGIYLYDLLSGTETWVSPQPAGVGQMKPAIYDGRIVWEDSRSDYSDIYMLTLGSADACPVADFVPSKNAGPDPLTVTFTDTSAGSPILYRIWNYSDGSTWYPFEPSGQTFSGPGVYHTRLTVGNIKCRNATPADPRYDIYVATPPNAEFSGTPHEGFAPLIVQFTDMSGGGPGTWTWDFGDGSPVSHVQNPRHTFMTGGWYYDVTLTVNNTFAGMTPDSETKTGYIRTFLGATSTSTIPIKGIVVVPRYGGLFLIYNATMLPDLATPLPTILTTFRPDSTIWQNITFISRDTAGFSDTFGNNTYMGNLSMIVFQTEDVTTSGVSPRIGTGWGVNYRQGLSNYPSSASISSAIWESATLSDQSLFDRIIIGSNFLTNPNGIAFTASITKNRFPLTGNATINMSVSRSWIGGKEAQIYITGYGINSAGKTVGSVIPAHYLFTDGNLDYFEANVPAYFTRFGISPLSGSGNPIQLITLSVTSHIEPPSPNPAPAPADSDSGRSGGAAQGATIPATTVATPVPSPTRAQAQPVMTAIPAAPVTEVITLPATITAAKVPVPPPVTQQPPAPPPTTAFSIFTRMVAWIAAIIAGNAVVAAIIVVAGLAVYLFRRG
jgi:TolB protein